MINLNDWFGQYRHDIRALYMLVYSVPIGQVKYEQTFDAWRVHDLDRVRKDIYQLVLDCDDSVSKTNADVIMTIHELVGEIV